MMDPIENNEPSTCMEHQMALQRHEELVRAIAQAETNEILSKLLELTEDFNKVAGSVQRIFIQCLVTSGYPDIQYGVLGSVDTEVGIISRTKESFKGKYERFKLVVKGTNHVDEQVKETCLKHASTIVDFLNEEAIQKICSNLLQFILEYNYNEVRLIAKSAKVLHGQMAQFNADFGDLPVQMTLLSSQRNGIMNSDM